MALVVKVEVLFRSNGVTVVGAQLGRAFQPVDLFGIPRHPGAHLFLELVTDNSDVVKVLREQVGEGFLLPGEHVDVVVLFLVVA